MSLFFVEIGIIALCAGVLLFSGYFIARLKRQRQVSGYFHTLWIGLISGFLRIAAALATGALALPLAPAAVLIAMAVFWGGDYLHLLSSLIPFLVIILVSMLPVISIILLSLTLAVDIGTQGEQAASRRYQQLEKRKRGNLAVERLSDAEQVSDDVPTAWLQDSDTQQQAE